MRCYLLDHPELHAKFREGDRQVLRDVWDFHEPQLKDFFESHSGRRSFAHTSRV